MAKKTQLSKVATKSIKKVIEPSEQIIDVSEEAIELRALQRQQLPLVSIVNNYSVKDRGKEKVLTIDFNDLIEKYPNNKYLIEQLIIGMKECIVPNCSYTTVKVYDRGIRVFIEFLNSERNLSNNKLTNVSEVNIILAKAFSNYLLSVYPTETRRRKWFAAIKSIIERLQKIYPTVESIGTVFPWPTGPGKTGSTNVGYDPKAMTELINACIKDIKEIKNFHKAYLNFDEELATEEWNIENIMYHIHTTMQRRARKVSVRGIFLRSLSAQKAILDLGYTIEQIQDLYFQNGPELAFQGRSPFATRLSQKPDRERANIQFNLGLGTLKNLYPLFPYYLPAEDAKSFLIEQSNSVSKQNKFTESKEILIRNAILNSSSKIDFFNGRLGKMAVYAAKHFVTDTLYPFFLLSLINTGWNVESLLSISEDVDAHVTPDLIDPENYVIIHGEKIRGTNGKLVSKVIRRSSKNKMLDTYQLLKYVESIVKQYKDSPHYKHGILWQFTTPDFQNDLISTFNENRSFTKISSRFVERHKLKNFSNVGISHPRIRSGYVTMKQLFGNTEIQISEGIDQADLGSIDHYISDESSNQIMDMKIKEIQKQYVNNLTSFKVSIVESTSLIALRNAINSAKSEREKVMLIKAEAQKTKLSEKSIVHLLDAGSQKYILACEDSSNPSWPGYEDFVDKGKKCKHFNKCAMCKQAIVFPEALPYIARRILDLEKLKKNISSAEWVLQFGDEYDAWEKLLENWNNKLLVNEAWESARMGVVVLPQLMRGV